MIECKRVFLRIPTSYAKHLDSRSGAFCGSDGGKDDSLFLCSDLDLTAWLHVLEEVQSVPGMRERISGRVREARRRLQSLIERGVVQ